MKAPNLRSIVNTSTMHRQEDPTSPALAVSLRARLDASRLTLSVSSIAGGLGLIGVGLRANA